MWDEQAVRNDFPLLQREIRGKRLVYLDSAATSQKPRVVLEAERKFYEQHNANVHRGAHTLGDESTRLLEEARRKVAQFLGAPRTEEVIFGRNTTEAINLVAYTWGEENVSEGEVILATQMEHHSNLVPWQELVRRKRARLALVKVVKEGELDQADYRAKLALKPKLVALTQVSNALGTINPVKEMIRAAHQVGAKVLVDGAQAVAHMKVNVESLGADWYALSGHKMLAPMGIGVLWGRKELLEEMRPFLTGGGMIAEVGEDEARWADLPEKFEAGTPNVAGAVGLAAAVEYLTKLGMERVREHDKELVAYALKRLAEIKEVRILGPQTAEQRSGSVSFVYEGVHGHDVATILDSEGVAVRSGHHCTMVLHKALGIAASVRASFGVYTTKEEIDALREALEKVKLILGGGRRGGR